MVQQSVRMTADDLLVLPDDAHRYELVKGELKRMPPASGDHGRRAMRFGITIGAYVLQHHLGEVFAAETGFILSRDPDTVRAPDFAFIRADRWPSGGFPQGYLPIAPDLAVEVVSPSETAEEIHEKVRDYLDAGTRQVWLLYRRTRGIVVYYPNGESRTLHVGDILDAGDTITGFRVAVADVFAD